MNNRHLALDTNCATGLLKNDPKAVVLTAAALSLYLPVPVIGELHYGALNSTQIDRNLRALAALRSKCIILDITAMTAQLYAKLRLALKLKGRPIPQNDLWIAAICVEHGLPLATQDAHFECVEGLELIRFRQP